MPVEKLTNGNFLSGTAGWTINNPTGGLAPVFGSGVVSFNAGNEGVFGDSIQQSFQASVGVQQTVSMVLYENNSPVADHSFLVEILDDGGSVIASHAYVASNQSAVNVNFTFVPTSATSTLRITNTGATTSINTDGKVSAVSILCFAAGTLIDTDLGPRPIEQLAPGDRVRVWSGGFRPVRLLLSSRKTAAQLQRHPGLRPVVISADALGPGLPERDLVVSRQHRVLVNSPIVARMFGRDEALVAACRLTSLPGVYLNETPQDISYFHLVLEDHDVVLANGLPCESFLPGREALRMLPPQARVQLNDSIRETSLAGPAALIPSNKRQRNFVRRHLKNECPVLAI